MLKQALTLSTLLLASHIAVAQDFDPAQHLADNCTRCHTDNFYTRPDRKAKSLASLGRIVRRCETNLGTGLFEDEVDELVTYLNDTYYKFK